jgi:hypothetical protein
MTLQFGRVVEVQVDTIKIGGLDASFRVVKTLKKEPNTCELTIYNLNDDHRDQLAQLEAPIVEISAGYKGIETLSTAAIAAVDNLLGGGADAGRAGVGLIFRGDVRDVSSSKDGVDWVTTLESGDGEKSTRFARINKSFRAGTSLDTVMSEVGKSMGVGLGNLIKKAREGKLLQAGNEFLNGVTVSGNSSKEFDRLVKSAGQEWSIQDGALQLLDIGQSLADISVVLTPNTGLVGSPTIGNDGVVRIKALLNSDIVPGRQLEVRSRFDNPFYVDIEATEI